MSPAQHRTIVAPRPPELPPRHRLPLVATIAPLVVSLVLFAVTRSPYTLVFAALGPVVGVASTVDSALQRRRALRRESDRFASELARIEREIAEAHSSEDSEAPPTLDELLRSPQLMVRRWAEGATPISVRLGGGELVSSVRLDASAVPVGTDEQTQSALTRLAERARMRSGAPFVAELDGGVGICGPSRLRAAVSRSLLLQLATILSPAEWSLSVPAAHEEWLDALPHAVLPHSAIGAGADVEFVGATRRIRVTSAPTRAGLPREPGGVLEVHADGTASWETTVLDPDLVSEQQATVAASAIARSAERSGLRAIQPAPMPERLTLADLVVGEATRSGLVAVVGAGPAGPVALDLVTDGPHAIVGGTTGSGKSELLLSWVLGMAADRSPSQVSFLFVDFKGGASFGSLVELPHSVGVLTDLDATQSLRAIESLAAELRRRERRLAERGLRSVDGADPAPFPRLVVIVDEYAALVATFPELHGLFADVAARGRSLGVHLVLCTQRPSGVVRDGILANCALRVSLRVSGAADSVAVLGTDAAAALPARPPGRALVAIGGAEPMGFQVALSGGEDVDRVTARWLSARRPPAPWLPPLPTSISLEHLAIEGAGSHPDPTSTPFGLTDLPAEQAQRPACYRPAEHGSLIVVGAAASGKSTLLAALSAVPSGFQIVRVPSELPALWDALTAERGTLAGDDAGGDTLLLLDDLDSVLARCPEPYQQTLVELLSRVLRDGPAARTWCVLTAQRLSGSLAGLAALCGSHLVLRMPSRAEHALVAGEAGPFLPNLPPGGGTWHGDRIQVVSVPLTPTPAIALRHTPVDPRTARLVVVSTRVEAFAHVLRTRPPERRIVPVSPLSFGEPRDELSVSVGDVPPILIGDPEAWQSQWSLFGALQRSGDVLFDGCSLAEVRALTRQRELPPPHADGVRPLWVRSIDGVLDRAVLSAG